MSTKKWVFLVVGILCSMLVGSVGQAQTVVWDAGNGPAIGDNLWSQAANWDVGIPTAADNTYLDTTAGSAYSAAFIDGSYAASCLDLTVGNGTGNTGTLTIYGGSSLTINDNPFIGANGGDGYVNIKPGATVTALDYAQLARTTSSYGRIHVQGTTASPTTVSLTSIAVGYVGPGDFEHEGGTVSYSGNFEIGDVPAGTYDIMVWHGLLGEIEGGEVTVDANGEVTFDMSY